MRKLNLNDFYYFVQVVDKKGFTAAGRTLNLPKSTLSRRITTLEKQLGARLLQRTSRHLTLTEVGQDFYHHAAAMLIEAEAAENTVKNRLIEPTGTVRVTCSITMAQFILSELLPQFMIMYPKINIVQHATNRYVDIIHEGFDIALRGHARPLDDSSLIQRPLVQIPWYLVGSISYFEHRERPQEPAHLSHHFGLILSNNNQDQTWKLFKSNQESYTANFVPRLRSDDMVTLKKAALQGLGIVALPSYFCEPELHQGKLLRVLPEWTVGDPMLTLLMPSRQGMLPSVRICADFLIQEVPKFITGKILK